MRFHVLGLSHTRTTKEYSVCAFTQKVRHLCHMLHGLGHEVYHYGAAGSDPVCDQHIDVVDAETFARVHGAYDYLVDGFKLDRDNDAYRMFVTNAVSALYDHARQGDFLLATFGLDHAPIAQALPGLITVESGIGYDHTFARFRVFESYAWMHYHYGLERRGLRPDWYDVVIANAVDPDEFSFRASKHRYHLFMGRPTPLKGRDIAVQVCQEEGIPLLVAGQGERTVPEGVTHLGVLTGDERAFYLASAAALWAPTQYIEPFGGVAVEAMISGTPVITTDWGGFAETVQHSRTGFRCRTYEQFRWAARNVGQIRADDCRTWAINHYALGTIALRYQEYFESLVRLHTDAKGWYAPNRGRRGSAWLRD